MYIVTSNFKDLKDKNHEYKKGDIYPHEKKEVKQERLDELMSSNNKLNKQLVKEVSVEELTDNQLVEYALIEGIDLRTIILDIMNSKDDSITDDELEQLKKKAKKLKLKFDDNVTKEELTSLIADKESSNE